MVVQMLVVPADLARGAVERERRVVVQVRVVGSAEQELRGGRGDRRPDVDQVQRRIVAGHHPRPDVGATLERHAAPRLVARLAGGRDRPPAPQLRTRRRVVGRDDAGVRPAQRHATAAREHPAVGDDRARGLAGRVRPVVEDQRLPDRLAGRRVEREDMVVGAGVDDQVAVDGDVAVGRGAEEVVLDVVGDLAAVLPEEVAGDRVDGLDDVARVRHVQHAVVGERRPLLRAGLQRPRPDHAEIADVVPRDRVQGAVAPSVERPAPHQPVRRIGVLQHRIGDRNEALVLRPARRIGRDDERRARQQRRAGSGNRRPGCTHDPSLGRNARRCRDYMHVDPVAVSRTGS